MFRFISAIVIRIFLSIYFKLNVVNVERFEKLKTGCIIAPNQLSAWDTVLIPAFSKRVMYMMAKEELFSNFFTTWLFTHLKVFPVKREKADVAAIKTSLKLLKKGQSICMFPEGTRNKTGADLDYKSGVIVIACTAKVPVIPVGIVSDFKFRSRVDLVYGEPIYFDEYYDKKMTHEEKKQAAEKLKAAVNKTIASVKK